MMCIEVERGARDFASGDRVMFLQNERGLGVKNGTLGTVEQVSEQSHDGAASTMADPCVRPEGLQPRSTTAMPRRSTRRRA